MPEAILWRESGISLSHQITANSRRLPSEQWEVLQDFLTHQGFHVQLRGDFFGELPDKTLQSIARRMAEIRVLSPDKQTLNPSPFPMEIAYEKRQMMAEVKKPGPVYSGLDFLTILREFIPASERSLRNFFHIVFTVKRLATWGDDRWHLRTILLSVPVVISLTGLVEAPARDREYYVLKQADPALGDQWLEANKSEWLDYEDERTTSVVRGYLYQAIFWWRNPSEFEFCDNPECALYNSHWQKEMLKAQGQARLCPVHSSML